MKSCTILFNCLGGEIYKQLKSSKIFCLKYKLTHIALYDYLEGYKYGDRKELTLEHKTIIKNSDVLILQYIKQNRPVIKHDNIISLIKKDCKLILIPHYTFSGYNYPFDIINNNNISENISLKNLKEYIDNLYADQKKEIILYKDSELENIKKLDQYSSIKCYDFVANNFCKHRLFYSRSYPTYIFFHYIVQQILFTIDINEIIQPSFSMFGRETANVLLPNVIKYLNLNFGNKFNLNCNVYEYIICCKKKKINELYLLPRKKGKKYIMALEEIIKSGKYR